MPDILDLLTDRQTDIFFKFKTKIWDSKCHVRSKVTCYELQRSGFELKAFSENGEIRDLNALRISAL
jgi:hypothetical protein